MRARLVVNPASGANRALTFLATLNDRLRTLVSDLDVTITTCREDAVRAAARAAREDIHAIYVAGGDGTLNAVVSGLAGIDGAFEQIAIGILPFGTGNDVAKALDLGEDPEAALERLLDPVVIDVDIGTLNDQIFVNTSAGGFVADVSALLTEGLKDVTGKLAYVIGGARALFGTEPFGARVRTSGRRSIDVDVQMFAVCNSPFIGGGYPIAPGALVDDGLLEVYVVRRAPTLEFVAILQRIAAGEHQGDSHVMHFRTDDLELVFDRRINVNADGEVLEVDRCRYGVKARAVHFFCGDRPHASGSPRRFVI
jgi:diacylglycerol kinase (ATP)